MGLLFVLVFWLIAGVTVAGIGTLVARGIASSLTRKADPSDAARRKALRIATFLPFACLLWAGTVFIVQAAINSEFLHRDIGIGDSSYCPLPNGYSILLIDVTDYGSLIKGKDADSGNPLTGFSEVSNLQLAGPFIFGTTASNTTGRTNLDKPAIESYFLLDTRTSSVSRFPSEAALRTQASASGTTLKLEPIYTIYNRYRFTWFDWLSTAILFLPPIVATALLLKSIAKIRSTIPTRNLN